MNRTAAIFCIWGDANDMIHQAIENIVPCVEGVIVVYSNISNFGQELPVKMEKHPKTEWWNLEPGRALPPNKNETAKRNYGINIARKQGYTHFIVMDFDEFYLRDEFMQEKERIERDNLNGLVCRLKVHFKVPTLCCDDHTLAPFIHKLGTDTASGDFRQYPFAYDEKGHAHIDPTRRLNYYTGIQMSQIYMHHFSWVRSDFNVKIQNSAARYNLEKSSIYADLEAAAPGVYNNFYRQTLEECPNYFNL
jgi:hypothetical protein